MSEPVATSANTTGDSIATTIADAAETVATVADAAGDAPVGAVATVVADVVQNPVVDADAGKVATLVANAATSAVQSGEIDTHDVLQTLHAAVTDTACHVKTWWQHLDADLRASLQPVVDAVGIKL